ncbi:ABC transporter permease, partial [Rhizobium sp. L74/93]
MNRVLLFSLRVLVAALILATWHVATTTTLFGNPKTMAFFFADPWKVLLRIVDWFASGSIWYHL